MSLSDWKAENSIPFIPLIFNNVSKSDRPPPVQAHSVMLASSKWCCRLVVSSAQWAGCNNLMIMIKIIGVRIILLLLLSSSPHTRIQNSVLSFDFPLSLNIQVHSPILLRFPGTLNQKFDKKIKSNRPQIIRFVVKSALIQFQPNSSSVTIYNVWHKNAQHTVQSIIRYVVTRRGFCAVLNASFHMLRSHSSNYFDMGRSLEEIMSNPDYLGTK